jgi:Pyridoxamine 5'-phosphate oxidase
MAEQQPPAEQPFRTDDASATAWAEGRRRLAEGDTYWLATVRPDGRPHVMPVLAVWVDDVYEVTPTTAFGLGTDGTFTPTRWLF